MSGLSKVERQRATIKRQRAEIETWREWAQDLIGEGAAEEGDGVRGGPVDTRLRHAIGRVWDATRDVLDNTLARHITVTANVDGEAIHMRLDLEGVDFTGSPADLAVAQTFFGNAQAGLERRFREDDE